MNRKIMKHLLWKDARTLGPLAFAIPILVLLFFWALALVDGSIRLDGSAQMAGGYTIWCLLPILVAYGAPAVLVGGEEESGSLAWLRTLPASWRAIARSKLIVASVCLMIAWVVATLAFLAYWSSIPERWLQGATEPEPFYAHLFSNVALSLLVMLASFVTAYAFRSPITALVAVVPVAGVFVAGVFFVTFQFVPDGVNWQTQAFMPAAMQTVFAISSIGALLVLYGLHQWIAWQRLTRPIGWTEAATHVVSNEAFRPPPAQSMTAWYGSDVSFGRPTKWHALLWQQLRQMRWMLGLFSVLLLLAAALQLAGSNDINALGGILGVVALFSMGSLTFYGDSIQKRCRFLADRGISPTLVWITRLLPVVVPVSLVVIAGSLAQLLANQFDTRVWAGIFSVATMVLSVFAIAQLTSQWSPRPVLTFFAAPIFFVFASFLVSPLVGFYPNVFGVIALSALLLLYASWRLMPRWMSGNGGQALHQTYACYALVALLIPYTAVLGSRWLTAPGFESQWREEMLSVSLPKPDPSQPAMAFLDSAFTGSLDNPTRSRRVPEMASALTAKQYAKQIRLELEDTDSIGEHISMEQLRYLCEFGKVRGFDDLTSERAVKDGDETPEEEWDRVHLPLQIDAAKTLLKWSRLVRERAISGGVSFTQLFGIAENSDTIVGRFLTQSFNSGLFNEQIVELCDSLPDDSEVRKARRNCLILDWRRAQSKPVMQRGLGGQYCRAPDESRWWLGVERMRASRYMDESVKTILEGWDSVDHALSAQEFSQLSKSLSNAYLDSRMGGGSQLDSIEKRLRQAAINDIVRADLRRRVSTE